ncbi:MAG: hypothetical protein ABEJ96_08715, partial [Thiohalorhabdaceae bacterium]
MSHKIPTREVLVFAGLVLAVLLAAAPVQTRTAALVPARRPPGLGRAKVTGTVRVAGSTVSPAESRRAPAVVSTSRVRASPVGVTQAPAGSCSRLASASGTRATSHSRRRSTTRII